MAERRRPDGDRIFVAAGHGGDDPGAVAHGLVERDLNAAVAAQLVRRLRDHDLAVDTDLEHGNPGFPEEADLASQLGSVSYYVALHHNAADPSSRCRFVRTGTIHLGQHGTRSPDSHHRRRGRDRSAKR